MKERGDERQLRIDLAASLRLAARFGWTEAVPNEAEDISKDWAKAGTDVLFHAVVEMAEIVR